MIIITKELLYQIRKKELEQMLMQMNPDFSKWTPSAVECYNRGCVCKNCPIQEIMSSKCRMKQSVMGLVTKLGAPKKEGSYEPKPFTI